MENVLYEMRGRTAVITLNRPDKLNALNRATITELGACLKKAENDANAGGVIITGAGPKAFAAGADIAEFSSYGEAEGRELAETGHAELFNLAENLGKPVLAAINGFALGGGLELALACHLRIAAEGAKMGLPETGLGLIPGYGGTQRLTTLAGKGRAMQMILGAEMIGAAQALEWGIVNAVVPADELMAAAVKMMGRILENSPQALAYAISAVNAAGSAGGYEREVENFSKCFSTPDFKEGTDAFLNKRKADFSKKV